MTPAFAAQLGLSFRPIDIGVQKIDSSTQKTYNIVIAGLLIQNKMIKIRFFE